MLMWILLLMTYWGTDNSNGWSWTISYYILYNMYCYPVLARKFFIQNKHNKQLNTSYYSIIYIILLTTKQIQFLKKYITFYNTRSFVGMNFLERRCGNRRLEWCKLGLIYIDALLIFVLFVFNNWLKFLLFFCYYCLMLPTQ